MTGTRLAHIIETSVRDAVAETMARSAEATGEELARELLRDPQFRAEMSTLLRAAFARALADLSQPAQP